MELKSPSKDEVGAENAFNQIRNYMQDIPLMFSYNAICVISDLSTNRAGTITSGLDRFMEWKIKDGNFENTDFTREAYSGILRAAENHCQWFYHFGTIDFERYGILNGVLNNTLEDTNDEDHVVEGIQKVFCSWITARI